MNINIDFGNYYISHLQALFSTEQYAVIQHLQHLRLLSTTNLCPENHYMALITRKRRLDGYVWYCTVCHLEKSVRNGSFFSEFPKISLIKLLHFIYEWSEAPLSLSDIHRYGICRSTKTPVALRKAMVQLCNRVMERVPAPRMGCVGQVVEVDESVFRRRKYHRGRLVVTRWVFGMVSLQHNRPRARFFVVGDRRAVTLSRVIQANVLPGTTIRSDEWRGYNGLNGLGYQHQTVNHSRHFVNPVTGAHTNNIENCWRWAKAYVKAYGRATSDAMLHYHLSPSQRFCTACGGHCISISNLKRERRTNRLVFCCN